MYFKRRQPGRLGLPQAPIAVWRAIGPMCAGATVACLKLMPLLALSAPCVLLGDRRLVRSLRAS